MKILEWTQLNEQQRRQALARPAETVADRETVKEIINGVRSRGDQELFQRTLQFDGVKLNSLEVSPHEIKEAGVQLPRALKEAMEMAKANIEKFHRAQKPQPHKVETLPGVHCEQRPVPIEKVGLYVPGGSAPLFSAVLMLALPAQIAGCDQVVVCTPPNRNGKVDEAILAACALCGVDQVFSLGGVQAIAAMAVGTQTVPRVNKIFGPGNAWVTEAKRLVGQYEPGVAVDLPAGPSEVLVVADGSADPELVAWDLLSQAEHGPDSQVLLISDSRTLLENVSSLLARLTQDLQRYQVVESALECSRLILCDGMDQALTVSDLYAPEHLILNFKEAKKFVDRVRNAGSVFVGPWSPESAGDYASGTNHVLPTSGAAASTGGVSLLSYYKLMTVQELTPEGVRLLAPTVELMAETEGLQCHAQAMRSRRLLLERS